MPELPEVEIVKLSLEKILTPETEILKAEVRRKDIRFPIPKKLAAKLKNQKVLNLRRRAKYLLFEMNSGTLLSHLGMTGSWRILAEGEELGVHDHFCLYLSDQKVLVYRDPRRFGMLDFIEPGCELTHVRLKALGPEPLDEKIFTPEYLFKVTRKRQTAIKTFIMDQKVVVGVGNIYASEALFIARINPLKKSAKITQAEAAKLREAIAQVLRSAIALGGSTIRDFVSSDGVYGNFQNQFAVYGEIKRSAKFARLVLSLKSSPEDQLTGARSAKNNLF